jgi:hypothetical protein
MKTTMSIGKITRLNQMSEGSSREAIWTKAVSVIKWIADKGVEVGIAALPYIIQALQNAPQ